MILFLFLGFLAAGCIHALATAPRTRWRFAELLLVYRLAGYFDVVMLADATYCLAAPEPWAAAHGWHVSSDNPFRQYAVLAYGSMAITAVLTLRLRATYLVAPAVCWSLVFLGATWIHIADFAARGRAITFHLAMHVFLSHGLTSVVLIALLVVYLSGTCADRLGDAAHGPV
jgi:hypothetical protein